MTTHELAAMLDHLRTAFAFGLNKQSVGDLEEVSAAFREGPDQKVKDFVKAARTARAPTGTKAAAPDVAAVVEAIRGVRAGTATADTVAIDFKAMTANALKEILGAFGGKKTGSQDELALRVRQLLVPAATPSPELVPAVDPAAIAESVKKLTDLRDSANATVAELRSGFEPIKELPKPAVEEIAKQMGYTLTGSKKEVLDRLLSNLERIKMSQYRAEVILNAV